MGLRERLRNRVDGPGGNARAHQVAAQRVRVARGQRAFELGAQRCAVLNAAARWSRSADRPRDPDARCARTACGTGRRSRRRERSRRAGGELVVRAMLGCALPSRRGARPDWSQFAACGTSRLSGRVEQRGLDALAERRCVRARSSASRMPRHRDVAGQVVDDRHAEAHGAGRLRTVHAHEAAHRLQDGVVAGQAAERAVGAEAGDRAVDEPRMPLRELARSRAPTSPSCRAGSSRPARRRRSSSVSSTARPSGWPGRGEARACRG